MPTFEGFDPDGWILRVERYAKFYQLIEEEKTEVAVLALEGESLL